jgi:hypothetical protein
MNLYEFSRLSDEEQYNTTWAIGVLIDQFVKDNIVINLYAVNEFYVEVYYDQTTNKILHNKTFKQGDLLDKYLNRIKL